MQATEHFQVNIRHRLHTKRNAIDASCAIAAKPFSLHTGRIGFECDFSARRNAPVARNLIEDGINRLRLSLSQPLRHDLGLAGRMLEWRQLLQDFR